MNIFKKLFSKPDQTSGINSMGSITVAGYNEKLTISPPPIRIANYPSGMTISFVRANGGYIVEINHHEDDNNRYTISVAPQVQSSRRSELFIVPEGADLASEIGKIITVALLKK